MTNFDWLWKGIFYWFCVVYHLQFAGVDGHHYACLTLNGNDGLCAARRLCRIATNEFLKPCEEEDMVCCPIQPSYRTAQRPSGTTAATTTKAPNRPNRTNQELPYDRDPPRTAYDEERPRKPSQPSGPPTPKPKRDSLPQRNPIAVPVKDPKVQPEHESREVVQNNPFDRPRIDVLEGAGSRPQRIPGSRRESQSSGSNQKRPGVSEDDKNGRGTNPRPQSINPSRYPSNDGMDLQLDPPQRQKPSLSAPYPDVMEQNPREHLQPLPQVPACGVKPYELFIAGGETSKAHEWPWMAAIFRRHYGSKPKTFQCGGSLINTRYVLTAAHCFVINSVILPASAYVVRLGSHALNSGEEYAVSNLVLHYNHSGSEFFNDIALVRLSSEIYISDKIAPICLPLPEMLRENFVGRMAVIAGWGDTFFRSENARVLKHVSVPVVSNDECAASYRRVRGAVFLARGSNHVMCAGLMEGGKDACQGDSGGPLMMKSQDDRWAVVGIVSLGYKCAEPGYPGVYTRVTHYMRWIQENMKPY